MRGYVRGMVRWRGRRWDTRLWAWLWGCWERGCGGVSVGDDDDDDDVTVDRGGIWICPEEADGEALLGFWKVTAVLGVAAIDLRMCT